MEKNRRLANMKKGRQIFLRKFLAVFLSISMIFGLFPGNLTVALAGDREENTMITGFVAVYPYWNENGEPSFPTDPYYKTELTGQENEYKITRTEGSILLIQTVVVLIQQKMLLLRKVTTKIGYRCLT